MPGTVELTGAWQAVAAAAGKAASGPSGQTRCLMSIPRVLGTGGRDNGQA
jgi:hypothetical protein